MNPFRKKDTPSCSTSSEELNESWLVVDQRKAWEKDAQIRATRDAASLMKHYFGFSEKILYIIYIRLSFLFCVYITRLTIHLLSQNDKF